MTSPSIVRIAGPEDRQECWRLLLQGHNENGVFKLAPPKVDFILTRCLHAREIPPWDTGPRGAIGVIGKPGALEALALLMIGEFWYSTEKHLEELLVFVDPEHRKSKHAQTLVTWMKSQAEETGIPLLTGIISNHRTEAKCRLYERMLPRVGAFFLYLGNKGSSAGQLVSAVAASS